MQAPIIYKPDDDPNLDHERAALQPYQNQRVKLTGFFHKFDVWKDSRSYRYYDTANLRDPEINGVRVCDHIWLHHADPLRGFNVQQGDRITMHVIVKQYRRNLPQRMLSPANKTWVNSFYIDRAEQITVDAGDANLGVLEEPEVDGPEDLPPAATVPITPPNPNAPIGPLPVPVLPSRPPAPAPAAPPPPILAAPALPPPVTAPPAESAKELLLAVKALAKRCGGLAQLRELVELLES